MEINLSNEMIEKITCVAFGRYQDLRRKIEDAKNKEVATDYDRRVNDLYLKDLNKALSDADEVHTLFLEMLDTISNN